VGKESKVAGRPVSWIQASRSSASAVFGARVRELAKANGNVKTWLFLDQVAKGDVRGEQYDFEGELDLKKLDAAADLFAGQGQAEYFICGPIDWMLRVRSELDGMGVSRSQMHLELFGTGDVPE
jgi:nitric oxide dioxygenase